MASRAAEVALSGGRRRRKRGHAKTTELHIRRAKTGGYIVRHTRQFANGLPAPDEEHVVPDSEELHDHIQQAMGDGEPEPGDEREGGPQEQPDDQGPQGGADAEG